MQGEMTRKCHEKRNKQWKELAVAAIRCKKLYCLRVNFNTEIQIYTYASNSRNRSDNSSVPPVKWSFPFSITMQQATLKVRGLNQQHLIIAHDYRMRADRHLFFTSGVNWTVEMTEREKMASSRGCQLLLPGPWFHWSSSHGHLRFLIEWWPQHRGASDMGARYYWKVEAARLSWVLSL